MSVGSLGSRPAAAAVTDLRAALPGWALGRVLTLAGWFAALLLTEIRLDGDRPDTVDQGLFAWDGAFYRDIAEMGYEALGAASTRFHPLLPLIGRSELGLLIVVNLAALLAGAAVHRLALVVTSDGDLARRAATLTGIAPVGFTLVWVYAEGLFLVLTALHLLAVHRRRWWWATIAGALATLARPTGVLLAVPALVGAWREHRWRPGPAALLAVSAPVVAMAGWLWWVEDRFGEGTLPLEVQSDLRGGTRFPPFRLVEGLGEVVVDPLGDGLHIPFVAGILLLTWVAWRRFSPELALYAAASVLVLLAAGNLNSVERYAFGVVPLVVAAASVSGGRWWRPVVGVSSALFVAMCALAWYGSYVP